MARNGSTQSHETTAFLDRGSHFEGTLTFQGSVRIDGIYKGDIVSGNHLVLGEQAEVEGTINVEEVIVSGRFIGTITAAKSIILHSSAVVEGALTTPRLTIDDGAGFNGTITMASQKARKGEARNDAELMTDSIAKVAGTQSR